MSKSKGKRWAAFFKRLAVGTTLLAVVNLIAVTVWSPEWFTYWQVPLSCTIFICFLGVLLFDTFFAS